MSRDLPRIKRYFTLRAIRTLYRILAILAAVLWIVFIIITAFSAEDKGLYIQSMIAPTIQAVVVVLSFYAVAQVPDVMLSINENQRQLAIQNRTLMRGIKRMLARMDDLEKKQMELHERHTAFSRKSIRKPDLLCCMCHVGTPYLAGTRYSGLTQPVNVKL